MIPKLYKSEQTRPRRGPENVVAAKCFGRWALEQEGDFMSKPEIEIMDDFEQFRIERDATMMHLALDELDPFVDCSPCYAKNERREIVTSTV